MPDATEDFLAHYGVSGMKWGVRRGGLKSRVKGAMSDSVQRRLTTNKEIAAGRGQTRDFRRVATFRGAGLATGAAVATGSKKVAARRARTLEARAKRIKSGKLKTSDVLDAMVNTPLQDLLVSRTDARGAKGATRNKVNSGKKNAGKILLGIGSAIAIGAASQAATGVARGVASNTSPRRATYG